MPEQRYNGQRPAPNGYRPTGTGYPPRQNTAVNRPPQNAGASSAQLRRAPAPNGGYTSERRPQQDAPYGASTRTNVPPQNRNAAGNPSNAPRYPQQGTSRTNAPHPASYDPRDPRFRPANNGAPRPSNNPSMPPRRPNPQNVPPAAQSYGQNRIYQNPNAEKRPQNPVKRSQPRPQPRPNGYGGYNQGNSRQSYGEMPTVLRAICGVLCVALLIGMSIAVTAHIQDSIPRPTIGYATNEPSNLSNTQQTPVPTNEVQNTIVPQNTIAPPSQTQQPVLSGTGRSVTIRAIGDVIIDKATLDLCHISGDNYDFSKLFSMASGVMSDADYTMINLESTLRKGKYGYSGFPQFSTPPSILEVFKNCGVDMLTMCNNHALDGYFDGLKMSIDLVEEAGLDHVGAYRTQKEFDTPEVYDLNGIKVGMINYTQYTNSMENVSDKAATQYGMRLMKNENYAGEIAALKSAGAEFIVAIMHWGEEYERYPESTTERTAKKLIAAGADLIIGGHPHVVQPAEYVTATDANGMSRTGLVIYSLGNFLSEHRHEKVAYTDNGIIFEFTLQENAYGEIEMVNPNCIPVYVWQIPIGAKTYDYRVLPSGQYLTTPPSGMGADQFERMKQSWNEIVGLMNGVIPVVAG